MRLETCIRKGLRLKSHRVRAVHEEAGRLVGSVPDLFEERAGQKGPLSIA